MSDRENGGVADPSPESEPRQRSGSGNLLLPSAYKSSMQAQRFSTRTILVGAVAVLLVVASGVAYFVVSDSIAGKETVEDAIANAQESIAEAEERIEALPADHPLRTRLGELQQWEGELKAYSDVGAETSRIKERADSYSKQADAISEQARIAFATISKEREDKLSRDGPDSLPK